MMWAKQKSYTLEYPDGAGKEKSKGTLVYEICQWAGIFVMFLLIVFAPQVQSLYIKPIPMDTSTPEALRHSCYSSVIYIEDKGYALNEIHELYGLYALLDGFKRGKIVFFRGDEIFEKAKSGGVWGTCYDGDFNETCQYVLYNDKVYLLIDGVYYEGLMVQSKNIFKESLKHVKDGTTYEWVKRIVEIANQ